MRRGLAWLVAVPLMLAGSQVAHVLAYRIVYPGASIRLQDLVATGHSYMSELPIVLGVAAAVVVLSLAASALDAARGRSVRSLPPWAFAFLPVVGFVCQEYTERWLAWGFFPWYAAEQPTFVLGIAAPAPVRRARLFRRAVAAAHGQSPRTPPRPRVAAARAHRRAFAARSGGAGVAAALVASLAPPGTAWASSSLRLS